MDFSKLMKQAKANQRLVEKKHECQKQQKVDKQRIERVKEEEGKRKAATKLREFKAATERARMEYKGLVGSGGITIATQGRQEPAPAPPPPPKTKYPQATEATKPRSKKNTAESRSTGSTSLSTSSITSEKAKSTKTPKDQSAKKPVAPVSGNPTSKTAQPSPRPKPPAMKFDDLLKLAKERQVQVTGREKGSSLLRAPIHSNRPPSGAKGDTSQSTSSSARDSSPIGRALLERTHPRSKLKRAHEMMDRGGKGIPSSSNGLPTTQRSSTCPEGGSTRGGESVVTNSTSSSTNRGTKVTNASGNTPSNVEKPPTGGVRRSPQLPSATSHQGGPSSLQRSRLKRPLSTQPRPQPARTKSFYGDLPPSARLIKDGGARGRRGTGGGGGGPVKYTSTWVREISDIMLHKRRELGGGEGEGYSDEEEDEDLAGFVASDDEEEMEEEEDYSSEIAKIFGYDRRKYADERYDGAAMESSYAQQMYEEQRSSRIGRQEDDEDLKRERELEKRKRRKMDGGVGQKAPATGGRHLVQSKLKFK